MEPVLERKPYRHSNQEGFILVVALVILVILSIMGITMNRNTTKEIQIAANDRLHKKSFFEADGGTEFAAEILEQNIACVAFKANTSGSPWLSATDHSGIVLDGHIAVGSSSLTFWQNNVGTYRGTVSNYPTDSVRDIWLPPTYLAGEPHTNITIEGNVDISAGASIIFGGGYLGLGRSMANAGVALEYAIDSQHIGLQNSESIIRIEYRHIVGREDPYCKYD